MDNHSQCVFPPSCRVAPYEAVRGSFPSSRSGYCSYASSYIERPRTPPGNGGAYSDHHQGWWFGTGEASMPRRRLVVSRLALKGRFCPSPKQVVARAMVLALVVAGFTVLGAGQALAGHVRCGDTITTDTTLTSNLVNCPNNGILIGADNITLDLNGRTIDGDATLVDPCPEGESCDVGVDNSAGHKGVTVEAARSGTSRSASSSWGQATTACVTCRCRGVSFPASSSVSPPGAGLSGVLSAGTT
jgi:hypothetical protein